jgi:hypothetical protein
MYGHPAHAAHAPTSEISMTTHSLRPLSLGEVLDVAFGLYRSRFAPLLVIAVVCQLIPLCLAVYIQVSSETEMHLLLRLGYYLLAVVLGSIGVAASTFVVSDAYLGRETSAADALARAAPLIGRLIVISILLSLVVFVGIILLIIPGVILFAGLLLSTVVAVIEAPPSATAAMNRSWVLTKGYKGKVLLTMIVAGLLLAVPGIALGVIGGVVGATVSEPAALWFFVLPLIFQIFVYPFVYVVQTVLYYDLRVRKEGFDLELLASALQPV